MELEKEIVRKVYKVFRKEFFVHSHDYRLYWVSDQRVRLRSHVSKFYSIVSRRWSRTSKRLGTTILLDFVSIC